MYPNPGAPDVTWDCIPVHSNSALDKQLCKINDDDYNNNNSNNMHKDVCVWSSVCGCIYFP